MMEFSRDNTIVKRCLQGMALEDEGKTEEASRVFLEAWNEAADEFEKYLAAYYVARLQANLPDKLQWLAAALRSALIVNDDRIKAALPALHTDIANCYDGLGDLQNAKEHREVAHSFKGAPADIGPFYHGTRADLKVGDSLTAGFGSNYQPELKMNHIHFTALINGAGLAAALAKGDGRERVYVVETTGDFENDPNVTNKKFPGNPTRSYRTLEPLKIVGELTDWVRQTPDNLHQWRKRLASVKGEIIN
jgi:tetratricopeptide (TPR) repeat protein